MADHRGCTSLDSLRSLWMTAACNARGSEHAAAPHREEQQDGDGGLNCDHDLEPVRMMRERDALEVHPVDTGDDDEGDAECADDGQRFRDRAEPIGDLRQIAVECAAQEVAIAVERI